MTNQWIINKNVLKVRVIFYIFLAPRSGLNHFLRWIHLCTGKSGWARHVGSGWRSLSPVAGCRIPYSCTEGLSECDNKDDILSLLWFEIIYFQLEERKGEKGTFAKDKRESTRTVIVLVENPVHKNVWEFVFLDEKSRTFGN